LLDRERPGWHQRVDLGVLFMRDGCRCVLGQLEGGEPDWDATPYLREVHCLGVDHDEARALGFNRDAGDAFSWEDLDAAWRGLVTARREAAS
jgi:hypothetical protein